MSTDTLRLDTTDSSLENIAAMRKELDELFREIKQSKPKEYPKRLISTDTQPDDVVARLYEVCFEEDKNHSLPESRTGIPTYLFGDSANSQIKLPLAV